MIISEWGGQGGVFGPKKFADKVLGSGQSVIVYGGVHRTTGHVVAIKVGTKSGVLSFLNGVGRMGQSQY